MNVEGIPRYDHIFIVMLENKATSSIKNSAFAPRINEYLSSGNQFTNYFATGNPSEPNYTALGGADDFGITDDSQWNCDATGANAVQDLPVPDKTQPGLASSPFAATCTQPPNLVNHNIVGRPNLFNALTAAGMTWRTYNESMNPGQDIRTDSVADAAVVVPDHVYAPGTVGNNATTIGNPNLLLPLPAGLYKTKHHPGMAYQNVRSAPEFKSSNRTLGGGQWDAALLKSAAYAVPPGYDIDQFSTTPRTVAQGFDPRLYKDIDFQRGRVRPRTILDFSVGADLMQKERVSMNLQFDVQNLTNELFLYNFESVFSGTHVGYPRLFSGRLSLRFK